jgi:hypothetical protein
VLSILKALGETGDILTIKMQDREKANAVGLIREQLNTKL